mgnify:CR=1 FL=1
MVAKEAREGQYVETSLLAAQIFLLDFQAARWLIDKEVPGQAGNNHPTSIPTGVLTRDEELALVRMHWAIENGCHWTMDVMLGEDEGHPCQASRASIETVSWLRLIGYNAVSAWRRLAPRKDGRPVAWARAMETLRDALLVAQVTDHHNLEPAIT